MPRNLDKFVTETLRELRAEGSEAFSEKRRSKKYGPKMTEEGATDKIVFLDQIVTSMHRPPMKGSTGFVSTTTLPDLAHTHITTSFCPPEPKAVTPSGIMTPKYKDEAYKKSRLVERPISELKMRPKFFKRAHNVFTNKVLLDLKETSQARNRRREQIWTTGKADYGFEGLEDSFVTQTSPSMFEHAGFDGHTQQAPSGHQERSVQIIGASKKTFDGLNTEPIDADATNDNEGGGFDNFQYADDFNPEVIETYDNDAFEADTGGYGQLAVTYPGGVNPAARPDTSASQAREQMGDGRPDTTASVRFAPQPLVPPHHQAEAGVRPSTSTGDSRSHSALAQQQYHHQTYHGAVHSNLNLTHLNAHHALDYKDKEGQRHQYLDPTSSRMHHDYGMVHIEPHMRVAEDHTSASAHTLGHASSEPHVAFGRNAEPLAPPKGGYHHYFDKPNTTAVEEAHAHYHGHHGVPEHYYGQEHEPYSPMPRALQLHKEMLAKELTEKTRQLSNMTSASVDHKKKKKKRKGLLPPQRKRKAFSRITFFEALLDTMEVPSPHVPRFGMLKTSPSRNSSRNRSRSQIRTYTAGRPATTSSSLEVSDMIAGLSSVSITDTAGHGVPYTSETLMQGSQEEQRGEDEDEEEPIPGDPFDKWDEGSVERAMTGDNRARKTGYR